MNAEAIDRAATRAAVQELLTKLAEKFALIITGLIFGAVGGGILVYIAFQIWLNTLTGIIHFASTWFVFGVGAVAAVWFIGLVKLLRFVGRKETSDAS
jgi:divalent metal cation (Fe/Co/Zn/Cd) transporter